MHQSANRLTISPIILPSVSQTIIATVYLKYCVKLPHVWHVLGMLKYFPKE